MESATRVQILDKAEWLVLVFARYDFGVCQTIGTLRGIKGGTTWRNKLRKSLSMGLPVVIQRNFNRYGSHKSTEVGKALLEQN